MPPLSGTRPMFTNDWMNEAFFAASTKSQASARFAPAPAATPFTAHTIGFSSAAMRRTSGL